MRQGFQAIAIGSVLGVAIVWWIGRLPLAIVAEPGHVTARLEMLGEYPSEINLVELRQIETSNVVWRVVASSDMAQVHRISLALGSNPAGLNTLWGETTTQLPQNSSEFTLVPNTSYELRICPASWWRRCASEVFQL